MHHSFPLILVLLQMHTNVGEYNVAAIEQKMYPSAKKNDWWVVKANQQLPIDYVAVRLVEYFWCQTVFQSTLTLIIRFHQTHLPLGLNWYCNMLANCIGWTGVAVQIVHGQWCVPYIYIFVYVVDTAALLFRCCLPIFTATIFIHTRKKFRWCEKNNRNMETGKKTVC